MPISASGHVRMMAAVQPFLSGAISKTVNMPASSTVDDDVERLFIDAWRLGLKSVAIYRDSSKVAQPLTVGDGGDSAGADASAPEAGVAVEGGFDAGAGAPAPAQVAPVSNVRVPRGRLQGLRHRRRISQTEDPGRSS